MFDYHITAQGRRILIHNMTDDHLRNTINAVCRRIISLKKKLEPVEDNTPINQYNRLLYRVSDTIDVEEAVRRNLKLIISLQPYLAEAFLRKMWDLQPIVADAMGRDSAVCPDTEDTVIVSGNTFTLLSDGEA